jgi:hypothetical protein
MMWVRKKKETGDIYTAMITFMALFNGKFDYKQVVSGYAHAIEST